VRSHLINKLGKVVHACHPATQEVIDERTVDQDRQKSKPYLKNNLKLKGLEV
jgi:hypothetical protein